MATPFRDGWKQIHEKASAYRTELTSNDTTTTATAAAPKPVATAATSAATTTTTKLHPVVSESLDNGERVSTSKKSSVAPHAPLEDAEAAARATAAVDNSNTAEEEPDIRNVSVFTHPPKAGGFLPNIIFPAQMSSHQEKPNVTAPQAPPLVVPDGETGVTTDAPPILRGTATHTLPPVLEAADTQTLLVDGPPKSNPNLWGEQDDTSFAKVESYLKHMDVLSMEIFGSLRYQSMKIELLRTDLRCLFIVEKFVFENGSVRRQEFAEIFMKAIRENYLVLCKLDLRVFFRPNAAAEPSGTSTPLEKLQPKEPAAGGIASKPPSTSPSVRSAVRKRDAKTDIFVTSKDVEVPKHEEITQHWSKRFQDMDEAELKKFNNFAEFCESTQFSENLLKYCMLPNRNGGPRLRCFRTIQDAFDVSVPETRQLSAEKISHLVVVVEKNWKIPPNHPVEVLPDLEHSGRKDCEHPNGDDEVTDDNNPSYRTTSDRKKRKSPSTSSDEDVQHEQVSSGNDDDEDDVSSPCKRQKT